ncbi:MAG TPA: glycoside hydrolase family 27 protein [Acidobacteriaceae bacterium]
MKNIWLGIFCFVLSVAAVKTDAQTALPLAKTPPMGWNSWNHFARRATDADIRAAADAMVSSGMRDAGYVYINIDGGWQGAERDADGVLHPDPAKYPDMKKLADYVHSKGLKFGVYSGPGPQTCGGQVASYGHEEQDAQMFADWGVDFLKYDLCSFRKIMVAESGGDLDKERSIQEAAYVKMDQALIKTGRPIVFSMCQYGTDRVWEWGAETGATMWRTTNDIKDNFESMTAIGFAQAGLAKFAGDGHWNDPDMLEVGNGGMTADEYRMHMSLWSIMAAPLLAGNDLTKMTDETKSILMNREVIAIDQDPLGKAGDRVWAVGQTEMWSRPLQGGATAVALFNKINGPTRLTMRLSDLGIRGTVKVRDVWAHKDVGVVTDGYAVDVPRHGVVMVVLTK